MADVLVSTLSEPDKARALRRLARLRATQVCAETAPAHITPLWPGEAAAGPKAPGSLPCGCPGEAMVVDPAGVEVCSRCSEGL